MAFTGQLGTVLSYPGNIELGGPAAVAAATPTIIYKRASYRPTIVMGAYAVPTVSKSAAYAPTVSKSAAYVPTISKRATYVPTIVKGTRP